MISKNWAPFIDCISKKNNTLIDNAKDLYVVMLMYNLIENSHNYSKTSDNLGQYYRNDMHAARVNSPSFKSKIGITGKTTGCGNTKDVEIAVPLKYFSTFRKTLEMVLIDCEINFILSWSADCVISSATGTTKF